MHMTTTIVHEPVDERVVGRVDVNDVVVDVDVDTALAPVVVIVIVVIVEDVVDVADAD
jgi:hypothetical protein